MNYRRACLTILQHERTLAGFTFPVKWEASVIVVLSCIWKPMKKQAHFAIVAAVLLARVYPRATFAFIHTGARRRAGRIGAANLNAGADGGAARRRNDFENHDRNEIDDNHFVRSSTSNLKPPTNKPRRTNRKTQARKRSKRIRTPKNPRWLGIIAICTTVIMRMFFRTPFCRSKISLYLLFTDIDFTASCVVRGVASATPHFLQSCQIVVKYFHLDSQFY